MNYKEKYENALEKARELKNKLEKSCSLATPTGIESIFPELAESEDEKIRKEVEKAAKDWYKENYEGENPQGKALMISAYIDGAIAWLEKQGEKKPAWSKEDVANYSKILFCLQTLTFPTDDERKELKTWLEKQCGKLQWKPTAEQIEGM